MFPKWEYNIPRWEGLKGEVRVISRKILKQFSAKHKDAESSLNAWYYEAKKAKWGNSHEVQRLYGNSSILKHGRIVFNISGNKYRLVVMINYETQMIYIRFIGTHLEYDNINAEKI